MGSHAEKPEQIASEFLAGASHELRTPLNAIVGMLELALGEHLSPTLRDYLTTARNSARLLTGSLDGLLDLAEADAGRLDFAVSPCDLEEIIAESLAPLKFHGAQRFTINVRDDLPDDLCGDAHRLRQIVWPLAEYAAKCLGAPTIVIEVGVINRDQHGAELEIGIGPQGVPAAEQRKSFVPFVQADASKYSAAGLGLTIARRWIHRLQGELWVAPRSEADGIFYGTLKLERNAGLHARTAARSSHLIHAGHDRSSWTERPLNVLVADDTQANQKVVMAVLTKRGHHVELADNGREALDRVRHRPFDVVLMDAQMPAMNGLEATTAIRNLADDARAKVPIIAMTAHAMREDRQRCLAAGMDDYLSKPIDVSALIARVEFHGTSSRSGPAPFDRPSTVVRAEGHEEYRGHEDYITGALARLGGDEALLRELIRLFRQDSVALMEKLRAGLEIDDAEAVARGAHNLKGLAANFDATALIRNAGVLERRANQNDLATAATSLAEMQADLDHLMTVLDRYERPDSGDG